MATVDLTGGQGTGTHMPSRLRGMHVIEKTFNVAKLISDGTISSVSSGDIFQVLDIPAESWVLHAGAEVITAFSSSTTVDIDFGEGDDFVDGADVTSTGYCAAGSNGHTAYPAGVGRAHLSVTYIDSAGMLGEYKYHKIIIGDDIFPVKGG